MPLFRKKPVVIEAMRWTLDNGLEIAKWTGGHPDFPDWVSSCFNYVQGAIYDRLHKTWVSCTEGDWIIKGIQGEFYPCKPDIFEATYEPVDK